MRNPEGQLKQEIEAFVSYLPLIDRIELSDFAQEFHSRLNHINSLSQACPDQRENLMNLCFEACGDELDQSILQRHCRHKPLGYAGDYQIIDWIHTKKVKSQGVGKLWDEFIHREEAAEGTRNRIDFFCDILAALCQERSGGLSVLDLACGPCRDIDEAILRVGSWAAGSRFHCVDIDERAVNYARNLVRSQAGQVTFEWEIANVFELEPSHPYDLVWSMGLFDYLNERYAVALLKRMWHWIDAGGLFVVGNVHPRNPSRNYMDWCLKWFLIHRTEEDFLALCKQAGIPRQCVTFAQEPLGIFVFCIVRKI